MQRTRSDMVLDFIIYTAIAYIGRLDKEPDFTKRLLVSLAIGLAATLLRALLNPIVASWKAKIKMKRMERKSPQNMN